jgi:hypothetical protein
LIDPNDGGSPVTSYNIQWSADGEDYNDLVGLTTPYLDLSYTVLSTEQDLVPGNSYYFKYRALNKYGWGEFSEAITILAAAVPLTTETITTVI